MKLIALLAAVLGVVFLSVWAGIPPSDWDSDTTVFFLFAVVYFEIAVVAWKDK